MPVWVDGLLETDYSVAGATLTFGTAPSNGSAIVAWDIVGGGIVPYDIGVFFLGRRCSSSSPRAPSPCPQA